jgi:hypothetical protein
VIVAFFASRSLFRGLATAPNTFPLFFPGGMIFIKRISYFWRACFSILKNAFIPHNKTKPAAYPGRAARIRPNTWQMCGVRSAHSNNMCLRLRRRIPTGVFLFFPPAPFRSLFTTRLSSLCFYPSALFLSSICLLGVRVRLDGGNIGDCGLDFSLVEMLP